MNPELEKIISSQWEQLPEEVRAVLADPELPAKASLLGKESGLRDSQIKDLLTEIMLVLLGFTNPSLLEEELRSNLQLSIEVSARLARAVEEKIFGSLKTKLEELFLQTDIDPALIAEEGKGVFTDSLSISNSAWHQNIDFILSGGNYGVFPDKDANNKMIQ